MCRDTCPTLVLMFLPKRFCNLYLESFCLEVTVGLNSLILFRRSCFCSGVIFFLTSGPVSALSEVSEVLDFFLISNPSASAFSDFFGIFFGIFFLEFRFGWLLIFRVASKLAPSRVGGATPFPHPACSMSSLSVLKASVQGQSRISEPSLAGCQVVKRPSG